MSTGIYVRDVKTGKVREVIGNSYMLNSDEEKWDKELPSVVEEVLAASHGSGRAVPRNKSRYIIAHQYFICTINTRHLSYTISLLSS